MQPSIHQSFYWGKVIALGVILGLGMQFAQAWTNPITSAPGGNVAGPINTGPINQVKNAGLGVTGALTAGQFVKVGQTNAVCDGLLGGALRFNTSNNCVEYCDTVSWKCSNSAAAPPSEIKAINYVPTMSVYSMNSSSAFAKATIVGQDWLADGGNLVGTVIPNDGAWHLVWNWPCDDGNWMYLMYNGTTFSVYARGDEDCNFGWRHSTHSFTVNFSN